MSSPLRVHTHGATESTALACAYVLVFGALLAGLVRYAWGDSSAWSTLICAVPTPITLALALWSRGDRKSQAGFISVAVLALPVVLIAWAGEHDIPAAPAPHTADATLDVARLFRGAAMVSDFPQPGVSIARSAVFDDGSAIVLRRFADARSADDALTLESSALSASPVSLGPGRFGQRVRTGEAELYLERHGRDLLRLQAADEAALRARISAQEIPAPSAMLDGLRAAPQRWPWIVAACALHFFGFAAFIYRAGSLTTRLSPVPGARQVTGEQLLAQIARLPAAGLPCSVRREGDTIIVEHSPKIDELRSLRISLRIDQVNRVVQVRELEGLHGAAPRDEEEADMRGPAEVGLDALRPRARKLYGRTLQTRIIEPARLALWTPTLEHGSLRFPGAPANAPGSDELVHALCALVIDAGFTWQPVFWLR